MTKELSSRWRIELLLISNVKEDGSIAGMLKVLWRLWRHSLILRDLNQHHEHQAIYSASLIRPFLTLKHDQNSPTHWNPCLWNLHLMDPVFLLVLLSRSTSYWILKNSYEKLLIWKTLIEKADQTYGSSLMILMTSLLWRVKRAQKHKLWVTHLFHNLLIQTVLLVVQKSERHHNLEVCFWNHSGQYLQTPPLSSRDLGERLPPFRKRLYSRCNDHGVRKFPMPIQLD